MRIELPYRPPYDWSAARRLIGAHAVPGAELLGDDGSVTRLLPSAAGPVAVTVRPCGDGLVADAPDVPGLTTALRAWLDLDLDPDAVRDGLSKDPRIGPLIEANPGLRRIGYPDAFEACVLTVLGQQVSLAAGRTFAGRLVGTYGSPGPAGLICFPSPDRLAALPETELQAAVGLTGARTRTVLGVARAFADDPDLATPGPQSTEQRDATAARLLALPGIGPWTVNYLRMRLLADPDAVPTGDLVLRRALGGMSTAQVADAALAWRPWRTYAVLHLWSTMAWA